MKELSNTQFFQVESAPQIQAKDILEIVIKGENYALSAAVLEAINDGKGAKIPKNKFSI